MIEFVIMLFVAVIGVVLGRSYQKGLPDKDTARREVARTEAIIEAVEREIITIDEALKSEDPENEVEAKWNKLL